MMRFVLVRMSLHALFFLMAAAVGMVAIAVRGVQAIGDSQGIGTGDLFPLLLIWFFFLFLELLFSPGPGGSWAKRFPLLVLRGGGELVISLACFAAATFAFHVWPGSANEVWPWWLRYGGALLFLTCDAFLAFLFYSLFPALSASGPAFEGRA